MEPVISVQNLSKTYDGGFQALNKIDLNIKKGELFALLGPNGAGKTTLISIICGIVTPTTGDVAVGGFDIIKQYRQARSMIGLVPQELATDAFETVWNTVSYSRGLFGKPTDKAFIEQILKDLALWDKRNNKVMTLSGGMKRRVLIAKALSHEPSVLFLDEPTAGVDVELRQSMWKHIQNLKERGVTIVLTTHYIQEAEEMADRVGVINHGQLVLVEEKTQLMKKLGFKQIRFELQQAIPEIPPELKDDNLSLSTNGKNLIYTYSGAKEQAIGGLLEKLVQSRLDLKDLSTKESSLEEIFVGLLN